MRNINELILSTQEVNKNWFVGFLDQILHQTDYQVVANGHVFSFTDGSNKTIILTEDEMLEEKNQWVDELDNSLVITSNRYLSSILDAKKIKNIYFPYRMWFYMLIPLRKLGILHIDRTAKQDVFFNFLNRRWSAGRYHLIRYLCSDQKQLLKHGFVTANDFSHYNSHPLLYQDTFGTNTDTRGGVSVSSNLENLFYISENIPGMISIQVETFTTDDYFKSCLTEKSMTALATQQIPIIVGPNAGLVDQIEKEGFDVFRDIINHDYDREKDYYARLKSAININLEVLSGNQKIPDIGDRLKSNQRYLFGQWTDDTLSKLKNVLTNFCLE
jgi:hypothetical protein